MTFRAAAWRQRADFRTADGVLLVLLPVVAELAVRCCLSVTGMADVQS